LQKNEDIANVFAMLKNNQKRNGTPLAIFVILIRICKKQREFHFANYP
jgi:hypothetical protein